MRKILFFLLIILLLHTPASCKDFCTFVAETAIAVMEMRQKNIPMHKQIAIVEKNYDKPIADYISEIITSAYAIRMYYTIEEKESAVVDFSSAMYKTCVTLRNEIKIAK